MNREYHATVEMQRKRGTLADEAEDLDEAEKALSKNARLMAIIIAEKPRELKWGDLIRILRKEADNCDFPEAERAYGELLGSGIVGNTAVVNGMPKGKFYLYEK